MSEEATLMIAVRPAELRELIQQAVKDALGAQAPELLSTDEIAKELGVSPDLVRLWVRDEDCPHIRVGQKKLRFRMADVVAWLEKRDA